MSTNARDSLSPPPPVCEGQRLCSGRLRALPITAGDQGDPPGGDDTASPGVGDDAGFRLASSASGPRMTPTCLAVVVEGTPLQQDNRYAGGSYSSSEEEDDSPPLLDLPAVLEQFATAASPNAMAAASAPDTVETVLGAITESERRRNSAFDSNMAALGGRHSRLVQMLSDVRGDISRLSSESSALIELNRSTRLAAADINRGTQTVADTMADFLRSVEASETQHRQALEASETRNRQALAAYRTSFEQSLKDITGVHAKTMDDMQSKIKSSFDRMKYLEKTFASVPERITNHLDVQLPAILTDVVGKAITPTLAAVLTESLPPTMALVLEGSFSDFQTRVDSAIGADSTINVRNLLEAATDSRVQEHMAVMTAIEGIDQRLSVLDDLIATSDASTASPSPVEVSSPGPTPTPSRAAPRSASAAYMPVPPTWGHGFQPSVTAPAPVPPPSGLRVDTSSLPILGGKIKTPRSTDPARRARTMKTSRFDLAGLADTGYHIGDFGVDTLTELIISNCGYQTFHVDHPEDVLLCFQEIINIHRVVVQTWTNTRTHFSGPVVE